MDPANLTIPLSLLELDLSAPASGWSAFLTVRNIPIVSDHIGRSAISADHARLLITEKQEGEARGREALQRQEQAAIQRDQAFRAALHKGVPWWRLPDGMIPGDAMALAAAETNHQKSVQESLLEQEFGGPQNSMIYQSFSK